MRSLDDMALFVEVVRHKSFVKAGNSLGVATSTVSLRIAKLEESLGLRLLNRTTRKVEPTEAGQLYFDKAVQVITDAQNAHLALSEMLAEPKGVVKVAMPVDFAYQSFALLVPEFHQKYPKIQLDIDTSPQNVDLIADGFDLAIRFGVQTAPNLIARPLGVYGFRLWASKSYLTQYGTPQNLEDLAHHRCLAFRQNSWRLFNGNQEKTFDFQAVLTANSLGLIYRLVLQDMGIALLPDILLNTNQDDVLKEVLPNWQGQQMPLFAVTSSRLLPKKVQVLIDFLKEKYGD